MGGSHKFFGNKVDIGERGEGEGGEREQEIEKEVVRERE